MKAKTKIRFAKTSDFDFVLRGMREIDLKIEKRELTKEKIVQRRKAALSDVKRKRTLVAEDERGNRLGFLTFAFSRKTPFGLNYGPWEREFAWVAWSYVAPRFRGRGVGRALYAEVERICRKRGVKEILLDVFEVNARSRSFHKKLGFIPLLSIYSKKTC
jgi:GNAT superfamily N-acetyltransferase